MNDRLEQVNTVLKDLFLSSENYSLNRNVVYNYLRNLGIGDNPQYAVNNSFFGDWISRFKNKQNIRVFVSKDWPYFCQFVNKSVQYDCVKIYIPLKLDHIYEGANRIFDFLDKNNIAHSSKISSDIRTDDVVVRLSSCEDAQKLQAFIDNDKYIQEGMLRVNPFCFNKNGVGYAFDGTLSYNSVLSTTIANYINDRISKEYSVDEINVEDFKVYINECLGNKQYLNKLRDPKHYERSDPELILNIIKLSLTSNNIKDFNNCYNNDCIKQHNESTNLLKDNNDKVELFNEVILTTMRKYPRGCDKKDRDVSGYDYLNAFFNGNILGVTRDNNLRDRVIKNLSVNDVNELVFNSGIVGDTMEAKRWNYVKMVMLNEMIRCSTVRFGKKGFQQVQAYVNSGKLDYITNSVDGARIIAKTLNPQEIINLLSDLGVNSISDYMDYYFNNGRKR